MKIKVIFLSVLIFFLASFFSFGYKYEKTIKKSFKAGNNFKFEIKNCNGNIKVETYDGDTIYIKAEKYSNKNNSFEKTKILFEEGKNSLRIRVKRPGRNCKASVKFYLRLPQNISYSEIETINGSLRITGKVKDIIVETVNGKISLEGMCGDAKLRTVNGSIQLYLKEKIHGDINVKTVNGSIKVELDDDSSFNLNAKTINGSIKSDFNLYMTKKFIGSKMDGTINKGEFDIKLNTVNGSIKILKN